MNITKEIFRYNAKKKLKIINYIYTTIKNDKDKTPSFNNSNENSENGKEVLRKSSSSKNSFGNSDNKEIKIKAKNRLNNLLKSFKESDSPKTKFTNLAGIKKQRVAENKSENKSLHSNLLQTIENVADTLKGDSKEIQQDLLESLHKFKIVSEPRKESVDYKSILSKTSNYFKDQDPNNFKNDKISLKSLEKRLDFDISSGLDIFKNFKKKQNIKLKLWDVLEEENLNLLTAKLPSNYFEELIMWTNQGKLWHFPIDNEQGLVEEAKVDFTEHVFLEEHLEPWCPKKGPIRHFMELVTIGLSKNPYLTVEDKKEHINWYKEYFEKKKSLLIKLGTVSDKEPVNEVYQIK